MADLIVFILFALAGVLIGQLCFTAPWIGALVGCIVYIAIRCGTGGDAGDTFYDFD